MKKFKPILKKVVGEISKFLIPINIKHETLITIIYIVFSGLFVYLNLTYSGIPRDSYILGTMVKKTHIPELLIFFICIASLTFRALRGKKFERILMSVILYSFITGVIYWGFLSWASLNDSVRFYYFSISHFFVNIAIFGLYAVITAVIWLLLLLVITVSYKFLKRTFDFVLVKRSFPPVKTISLLVLSLSVLYISLLKIFEILL